MPLDNTYFETLNFIPNMREPEPNSKKADVLSLLIERGKEEVLSKAFGFKMWDDIKPFIASGFSGTIPTNYKELIEGKAYQKNGKDLFWRGLWNDETKESLIADWVYYHYHTNNTTQTTEFGEVVMDNKIGARASVSRKAVKAWNRFLVKFGGQRFAASGFTAEGNPYYVRENRLGNGYWVDYYGYENDNGEVSLMQFLTDNKADYPLFNNDVKRIFGEFKNEFGI